MDGFGKEGNLFKILRFEHRALQPVANRYANHAVLTVSKIK